MDHIALNLFTITSQKTGIEEILNKYVNDGFLESYDPGEPVFILKNGTRVNQARKIDIDWEAMNKESLARAHKEAVTWNKEEDEEFIATRLKVHKRPTAFIDKYGKWHDEDEDGLESQINDEKDYNFIWNKTFTEAGDDDVFSHWNYRI
ncbi:MAG: hypothetical protein ACOYUB_01995 [Patescibacteria group bacterium]